MRTFLIIALLVCASSASAQQGGTAQAPPPQEPDKHLLGVIPNNRVSATPKQYTPLTPKQKFTIARKDAFDPGTFMLAGLFAAEGELRRSTPAFGTGVPGFARYYAAATGDQVIGDFMTEGVFPTLLHHDPRYFERGTGSAWSRLGYAVRRVFQTRADSGGTAFNYSEFLGNAAAIGISDAYYPTGRTLSNAAWRLGTQVAVDTATNVVTEFWPDIKRLVSRRARPRR